MNRLARRPRCRRASAGAWFAACAFWATPAPAIEPEGVAIEIGGGPGLLHAGSETSIGPAGEIAFVRGLTDVLVGRFSLGIQTLRQSSGAAPTRWQNGAGVTFALRAVYDVARVVPYAEVGAGVAVLSSSAVAGGWWLSPHMSVGATYLIDRRWSLTPGLRVRPLLFRFAGGVPHGVDRAFAGDLILWLGRAF